MARACLNQHIYESTALGWMMLRINMAQSELWDKGLLTWYFGICLVILVFQVSNSLYIRSGQGVGLHIYEVPVEE